MFHWYHTNNDGTCSAHADTPEVRARIDAGEPGWYGTPEGPIIHGGVRACAFTEHAEQLYDARAWLQNRVLVPMGERVIRTITAERE